MTDADEPTTTSGGSPLSQRTFLRLLGQAARGLAVGAVTIGAAVAIGYMLVHFDTPDTRPCDSDLGCFPDLGPLIAAVMSLPATIVLGGPAVARLLRIPCPWLFAIPAGWAAVLACVGLGPADQQNHWPFNDAVSSLLILWIPYGLIGVWAFHRWAARHYLD